eukprot:gene7304-7517_t
MAGVYWNFEGKTDNCSIQGLPIKCKFHTSLTKELLDTADLLYYHIPGFAGTPRPKAFPAQLRLAMRTCAQVVNWYSLESFDDLFKKPAVPVEEKQHALVYINSNCGAQSGRTTIMRQMMDLKDKAKVPVHSYGRCDNNKPWPAGNPSKVEVFSKYKFCVSMENSIRQDYVTEKMWDGLTAGCIPVYLGPPLALQIVPDAFGVIMYDPNGKGNASTPEGLDALLNEIGNDKQRYEAMLAWRKRKPREQPSPLFRYLWDVRHTTGECFLCQFLAQHRVNPAPRYTTCLFNRTWMEGAGQAFREVEGCN